MKGGQRGDKSDDGSTEFKSEWARKQAFRYTGNEPKEEAAFTGESL
jgi:hypothetical protein